jgi:glycosyltransferase involved in cell wall biosynthesis
MNVLYSFRTRGVGAEAVHISGVTRALERLGHKVFYHSPCSVRPGANPFSGGGGRSRFWGFLCRMIPGLGFELMEIAYNIYSWLRARRRLRSSQFDLIYERHAFFHFATGLLARKHSIPLVVEVNELAGDSRIRGRVMLSSLARRCDRKLFECASLIVVVSPYLKREIIKRYGIPEHKIDVQCNAVDEHAPENSIPCKLEFLNQLEGASCVFGFVGWFVHWHRLDILMDVFSRLCCERPDIDARLLIVGDGPLKDELSSMCRKLAISEKVIFAGSVEHACIPRILSVVDIAVIPHSNEFRSPVKLFEYMAGGCVVVAPQTEPISSVISHGENGLLFRTTDSDQMLDMFIMAASDKGLRASLGERAGVDVKEKYTWMHNVRRVLERMGDGAR